MKILKRGFGLTARLGLRVVPLVVAVKVTTCVIKAVRSRNRECAEKNDVRTRLFDHGPIAYIC